MNAFFRLLADPALTPILAALPQARLVGGCVRDTLANRPVADIDIATPDPPDRALDALQRAGLKVIPTGLAHGTVTAISQGRPFEITTLRRDEETDGRHARVAWTTDFDQDAARRDFTINALSLDQQGVLHDPFGGAADLAAGRVRFVGDAATRVAEDALRILRFFRFYARYAVGTPDHAASAAIAAASTTLARLSAERVWSELKRILAVPAPLEALRLMQALGVLAAVLPEATNIPRLAFALHAGASDAETGADPILRLAALLTAAPAPLARRLRLSAAEAHRLALLAVGPIPSADEDDSALRRYLAEEPADILTGRLWLAGSAPGLQARLAALPRPVFPLEGRHALALGASPGPHVGEALRAVRAWWLQTGCTPDLAACTIQLASLLPLPPPP